MRRNRGYKANKPFRDARLVVIATEGAKREVQYFEVLAKNRRRVIVEIVPPDPENKSAPIHTFRRLERYLRGKALTQEDRIYVVMDTDRWTAEQLMEVVRACHDKGWQTAISNPCFEVWLLLHYTTPPIANDLTPRDIKRLLTATVAPADYTPDEALKGIGEAIQRASQLDDVNLPLSPYFSTQVYRIAEVILRRST